MCDQSAPPSVNSSMKRVVVREFGGPEQLTVEPDAQIPVAEPGALLVDVEAAGVNYIDVYQRKGLYKGALPFTPGLEGVGRVRRVGDGVGGSPGAIDVGPLVSSRMTLRTCEACTSSVSTAATSSRGTSP